MIKTYKGQLHNVPVEIRKLSAESALKVHGRLMYFLSDSITQLIEGQEKDPDIQMEYFGKAINATFGNKDKVDDMIGFIKDVLTDGNVSVKGARVTHLDDLERFDDVDGSALMYSIFWEWARLNVGDILGNVVSSLGGSLPQLAEQPSSPRMNSVS